MNSIDRCNWAALDPLKLYHDTEWGVPLHHDQTLFEFLILEGQQAGLRWETILKKRDGYKKAFDGFDPLKITSYSDEKIISLISDNRIIRNRLKILAIIQNARAYLEVKKSAGSFNAYLWDFVGGRPIIHQYHDESEIPSQIPEAIVLSKDLKSRGFKFIGPTICYAFMQATGMVNDHVTRCFRYKEINQSLPATGRV